MKRSVQRPEQMVVLADWLVGPFSYEEKEPTGEILEWQDPFYNLAVEGLRRIAGLKEDDPLPEDFQPDPMQGVELYRELAYERKVQGMINSLCTYIADYKAGSFETKLRDHQQEIMDVIAEEVMEVRTGQQINVKSPTGTGKTAVLTTLVEALKYKEQPSDKVRALVLLPTKDILNQTAKAFTQFTDIQPAIYFGESQEIDDVTAMTYQSFKSALKRGDVNKDSFDVVIRDEADTFSRGKTGELIDAYCYDTDAGHNKLVIGLTATPHEEQKLSYERTLLESIGDRLLAPLSTYQRYTQAVVHEDIDRDWREDFKESEVTHLMEDEARNAMIVQEVQSGLASGRRVMVRCIPGQELKHPKILQKMLLSRGKVRVKHPYMGDVEHRPIRPVVIPGTMTMRQRELLTGMFNNHLDERVDVLLFVGTLIRGFDSPVAKKVINAAPTRTPTTVEQLLGRVERWFETYTGNVMDAQAVDIVDHTDSGQVTFADIINRDAPEGMMYKSGAIVGPELANLKEHDSSPQSAFEPISPEAIGQAMKLLVMNGMIEVDGFSMRATHTDDLPPRTITSLMSAAALLKTAKVITEQQTQSGQHVSLDKAALLLNISPAELMNTAHRMRVGLEVAYRSDDDMVLHFFSSKAFERLKARFAQKRSR
jgi:superfamily II DNA or RNA helicase